jgi:hypothetical protein
MTRFCSIFTQLLQLFPRTEFQQAVGATKAERHARGFTCWGQFVAMLFCQLGRAHSLREICGGLASCEGKLAHLGIEAPSRTTLAYANAHRPWQLYERVFYQLLAKCQTVAGSKKFRFKNKLKSLDATVIDLCAEIFGWAKFRQTKGAVKLHFTLDHDGYLPTALVITEGKRHDVTVARQQTFEPGTILVFDRGYLDFAWFARLTTGGVLFVTRMKDGTAYEVIERRPLPATGGVVADELIVLRTPQTAAKYEPGLPLRRVAIITPDGESLVFLTNHLDLGPTTVGRIYKDRWQIELLFESSTWCTPSDAMEFQGSVVVSRAVVGSLDGDVMQRIPPRPRRARSMVRWRTPASPATASVESAAARSLGPHRGWRRPRSRTARRAPAVRPRDTPQSRGGCAGNTHVLPSRAVHVRCGVHCD